MLSGFNWSENRQAGQDVHSDISPVEAREFAKSFNMLLDDLGHRGLAVGAARHETRLRSPERPEVAFPFTYVIVLVGPEATFRPFVLWDRTAKLRLQ